MCPANQGRVMSSQRWFPGAAAGGEQLHGLITLLYITCYLADTFIQSDFQLMHSTSMRGHSGLSILPMDTLACRWGWLGIGPPAFGKTVTTPVRHPRNNVRGEGKPCFCNASKTVQEIIKKELSQFTDDIPDDMIMSSWSLAPLWRLRMLEITLLRWLES